MILVNKGNGGLTFNKECGESYVIFVTYLYLYPIQIIGTIVVFFTFSHEDTPEFNKFEEDQFESTTPQNNTA